MIDRIRGMIICAQTIYENLPLGNNPYFTQEQVKHMLSTVHFKTKSGCLGSLRYYPPGFLVEILNIDERSVSYHDFSDKEKLVNWLERVLA